MKKEFSITPAEEEILRSINRKIMEGNTLEDIVDSIFPDVYKILPCNRLEAGLIEENGQRIVTRYVKADYKPLYITAGYTADVHGSFYQSLIKTRVPAVNVLKEQKQMTADTELVNLLVKEGIYSYLIIPVISRNAFIGIISCGSREKIRYTQYHVFLFAGIVKFLQHLLEKTFQNDQVEKHFQAYMEMLSFVSHELKSPISSIITLTRTMADGYYGKLEKNQRDIIRRIIKKAEYLDAVSNQYLNLARFESNIMKLRPVLVDFIDEIIESTIELLMPNIEERNMKLEREYDDRVFPVLCDPDMIRIVMMNLLNNAIKYGNKNGIIRISLSKVFKQFILSVWNEGHGFSEEGKRHLFKKFSRLEISELIQQKGSGIGLYLSWKIIQLHGGRISADSKQGLWAKFSVEMAQHMDISISE